VALRCDHSNLETVYVSVREGALVVTDRGETFRYLEPGDNADYSTVSLAQARSICEHHGVEVRSDDPELYATLEREVLKTTPIADAIARVASAVDELFASARDRR
jgi:hypothetical protein